MHSKLILIVFIVLPWLSEHAFAAYFKDVFSRYNKRQPTMNAGRSANNDNQKILPYFDGINIVTGKNVFDVNVVTDTDYQDIQIMGNPVAMEMKGTTVSISVPENKSLNRRVNVYIRAGQLHRLNFNGSGDLSVTQLNTPQLDVTIAGNVNARMKGPRVGNLTMKVMGDSSVTLVSVIGLRQLSASDNAKVNMYWVDSSDVMIRMSGNAYARLAGIANLLDIVTKETAHIDARYLRAKRGFIETHHGSWADVSVRNTLNTLAYDYSRIDYYRFPIQGNDYMRSHGAVLDYSEVGQHRGYFD